MLLSLLGRDAGPCLSASDRVRLRTRVGTRFVDLTDLVLERVRQSGVASGLAVVQTLHTTAALAVNENEPLLLSDLERTFERSRPTPWATLTTTSPGVAHGLPASAGTAQPIAAPWCSHRP